MKRQLSQLWKKLLIFFPLVIAAVFIVVFMRTSKDAPRKPQREAARVLRVIKVTMMDVVPRVLGYGTAEPDRVWRGVARVEGQVVRVHPMLRSGAIVKEGTELLCIDQTPYKIAVASNKADIGRLEAELAQLEQQSENDRLSLKIEMASLRIAESDFKRLRELAKKDTVSKVKVNAEERTVLAQKQRVQAIRNSLNLAPKLRVSKEAALAESRLSLTKAELDLSYTMVRVPFTSVLADVHIEEGQFVSTREKLLDAYGIEATRIEAQIPYSKIRHLLNPDALKYLHAALTAHQHKQVLGDLFGVTVRFHTGAGDAEWEGRLQGGREVIDEKTRTVGLTVIVENPYQKAQPPDKPPLVKGTYCEVEFRGATLRQRVVIPRTAVHSGHVYILDTNSRLERRPVRTAFSQSNFVVIKEGLQAGDILVVSDPTPAIEGLLVQPVEDTEVVDRLRQEAAGKVRLR
jgi:multidrug efflux pump subunit AcrA (membrane-fusion protein)